MAICEKCGTEFEPVTKRGYTPKNCSRSCANRRAWGEDDKLKKSAAALASDKVAQANRDPSKREKKRQDAIAQAAAGRTVPPSDEAREKAVATCKRKAEERRMSFDFERETKKAYRAACKFSFNVYDYPDLFDLPLLESVGWYSAVNRGNNAGGVSRDHMYSIKDGWENNVHPSIISHPANCRLILQSENWNKRGDSSITLDELMHRIEQWGSGMGTRKILARS